MTRPQPLEYARPVIAAASSPETIVEVRPDGVVLRVARPWLVAELARALFYFAGAFGFAAVVVVAVFPFRGRRLPNDAGPYLCGLFGVAIAAAFIAAAVDPVRTVIGIVRRDPRVGTRFFAAADQVSAGAADAVRSVEVAREPLQWTLTRPFVLRIKTARGRQYQILRGRPREELERTANELRALLRLEAAPLKGFPVILPNREAR